MHAGVGLTKKEVESVFLIQILLPLYDDVGSPIPHHKFRQVREEMLTRFGGLTAYSQAPAEGFWQDDGDRTSRDKIVVFEVMLDEIDREWWADYRRRLEERFSQESIVIRAQQIELL
jgi:hypothetical protein